MSEADARLLFACSLGASAAQAITDEYGIGKVSKEEAKLDMVPPTDPHFRTRAGIWHGAVLLGSVG